MASLTQWYIFLCPFFLSPQKCNLFNPQMSSFTSEAELNEVREVIQQLLRWGWKYNKNLEEQAAQLHMLTSWSQIVEVTVFLRNSSFFPLFFLVCHLWKGWWILFIYFFVSRGFCLYIYKFLEHIVRNIYFRKPQDVCYIMPSVGD